jgi:3-oxoacyl-[acyl-carrier protein] reductase
MDLGLSGKVALVTGASKGIGRGIAAALGEEGARVAVSSRSRERIEEAAAEMGALPLVHDSGEVQRVPELVDTVERELGPIDVLVTNTGGPPPGADPFGFSAEQWSAAYRELVLTPIALIERVVPGMRERGFGRVLSVGSSAAREPIPGLVLSSSHRPGLLGALKTIAREVARDGVTLNSVLPGRIATDRLAQNYGSLEAAQEAAAAEVPARRLATVEELAAVAVFLCSERASYVTGTTVLVDGGLTRAI